MSSKIKGLRRVGIVGLSTVVAASMMSLTAVSAQAAWATSGGGIGLVDTDTTAALTQGATLVFPGTAGQALGDVRLLIPNTFKNGDTIDLTVFDRSATLVGETAGDINADANHKLGFTAAPTVAVSATPLAAGTTIGKSYNTAGNTELAAGPTPAIAGAATTAPVFATSVEQSSRANGLATDIIRLRVNGVQAAGTDATAKWMVTLSGLKADVGPAVSPGELRVVPFAYDGTPGASGTTPSSLFGNTPDPVEVPSPQVFNPVITNYTVPAYVAPVTFNIGAPNTIVSDGTIQTVGDITIAETNNYSLQNGTYTVNVSGATVANTSASPITVTASGLATSETVVKAGADNAISFTVAGASNTSKISVKLSGLQLSHAGTAGPISYTLSGGSIDGFGASVPTSAFLITAGTSTQIPDNLCIAPGTPGVTCVDRDQNFSVNSTTTGVNQNDIVAPKFVVNSFSTDVVHRIGGADRYGTAAKIALNNGNNDSVVLASGENFPDALSSGYLANQIGGASILLTATNSLPAVTADAMRTLGTKTVYLMGQTAAISAGVEAQLRATPQYEAGGLETLGQGKLQVIRLGGADRFATNSVANLYAAANFQFANPVGRTAIKFGQASKLTALVASGNNFPDALAAGPATAGSFRGNLPLILTNTSSLNPNASSQLTALGIQQAVIVGGEQAVSAGVESSITGTGVAVKRIGGATRYDTATLIADFETAIVTPTATTPDGGLGFDAFPSTGDNQRAYLATGLVYADALSAAPLAGGSESPILLTNPTTLSTPTQVWLSGHAARYSTVVALGLGFAVSNAVLDAANTAIAGG